MLVDSERKENFLMPSSAFSLSSDRERAVWTLPSLDYKILSQFGWETLMGATDYYLGHLHLAQNIKTYVVLFRNITKLL